jgi:topoisomerase-4 subunit A
LTNRYEPENIIEIQKYNPLLVISAVYYDGSSKNIYVKRFKIEASQEGKKYKYITEHNDSKLLILSIKKNPKIEYTILKGKTKDKELEQVSINDLIEVKGWKALGNKLTYFPIKGDIKDITPEDAPEDTEYIDIGTTIEFDLDGGSEDTGEQKELFD